MGLLQTLRFITSHPLNSDKPVRAVLRFVNWQLKSRLSDEITIDWVEDSKLIAKHGMTGATGNIYCGLHEFVDMAFLLHLLRPDQLFADIGANIGSYTVLASKVCRARSLSIEPDPGAMECLRKNVKLNKIDALVRTEETALGATSGTVSFTVGRDTVNKVASEQDDNVREVRLSTLDELLMGTSPPHLIKMDVEGFEAEVLKGSALTLSSPKLVAVITESQDESVVNYLSKNGFLKRYYDPFRREIYTGPKRFASNNALFLRDVDLCQKLVFSAPKRNIMGTLLVL